MVTSAVRWPLVGRERELALVGEALGRSRSSGIVIAGPAGVGKTRLAEELIGLAESSGFAVVWVLATRAARAVPFGAFASVLPSWPAGVGEGIDRLRWTADALLG